MAMDESFVAPRTGGRALFTRIADTPIKSNTETTAKNAHLRGQAGTLAGRVLFWAALVGVWWLTSARGVLPSYLLPSPVDVLRYWREAATEGTLLPAVLTSLTRAGAGYGVSLLIGIPVGLLLARVRWLDDTLQPAIVGLQSLPSICWFPLALLWFGLNEQSVLFVVVMGSVFALIFATRGGVRNLSPVTLRAAQVFGARGFRLWRHVLLPAILPALLAGMRQGWAFAWRSLMAAELLSQSLRAGVGHLLENGRDLNDMPTVLGMIGIILLVGLLVDRVLFLPVERVVARRWGVQGA